MAPLRRDALKKLCLLLPALFQGTIGRAEASGGSSERSKNLEDKLERLTSELERMQDVNKIQNLVSKMCYLYEAGLYEERLKCIASKTPGVTVEIGIRGVFEGYEGARKTMVDIEKNFEHSHALGMKEAFPNIKFNMDHSGQLESELLGTPIIVVAGDGKTAKGEWLSLMAVGKTHEGEGPPQALWIWWKTAADFVREDGEWKVWHYLKNPIFAAPYKKDWVENSMTLPPVSAMLANGLKGHGGIVPDKAPTKLYDSYRITRDPRLIPKPPEPYETFDEKDSYSY